MVAAGALAVKLKGPMALKPNLNKNFSLLQSDDMTNERTTSPRLINTHKNPFRLQRAHAVSL